MTLSNTVASHDLQLPALSGIISSFVVRCRSRNIFWLCKRPSDKVHRFGSTQFTFWTYAAAVWLVITIIIITRHSSWLSARYLPPAAAAASHNPPAGPDFPQL